MADGKVIIDTGLDTSGIEKDLGKLGGLVKTGMGAVTKAVAGVSAALGAAGGVAISLGSDFESSLAKASTLFGDTAVDTDNLKGKILGLSNTSGVAADAIGNSLYNALSAGIPVTEDMGEAMQYMEDCSKLAKAGFTDVDTAVTTTAKVLNAYKMDVSDTGTVHKILMQTQNKGITTVGELGASLAQVTPTAAAMNVQFEQVGAALATMTAQGTPTAQATTQLNSLFAELGKQGTIASKSLEKATEGTKYAGKGFSELMAEGVPLNEVLDLMGVSADMSDQSLIDMFGSIEAGKAALAMSGQNAQQFTENLAAMSTETDVVGDAYAKVMDTLEEKTNVAINSAKNLGIAIFQDMQEPLKDLADEGTKYIEQLAKAFENNGIEGLVEEAGNVFADVAVKAAEQAPKLVDTAIKFIQAFVNGLAKNKDKLIAAAGEIVKTLAGGLTKLLPKEMQKPVKDAIDAITKSFQSGGLKKAVETVQNLFKNIGKVITGSLGPALKIVTDAIDLLADNLDILVPLLATGATAFGEFKIISTITGLMAKNAAAVTACATAIEGKTVADAAHEIQTLITNGTLTAQNVVVGVLTGQITLAAAATAAWDAAMAALGGPIGMIITAVAAVGVGIAAYCLATDDTISETDEWVAKQDELIQKLNESNEATQKNIEQREQSQEKALIEADSLDILAERLFELNGKQEKTNEEKAEMSALVDELNDKMPDLNLVIDEETGYLNMNEQAIKDVISANKEMIMVKAAQSSLTQIAEDMVKAEMDLKNATEERKDALEFLTQKQAEADAVNKACIEGVEKGTMSNVEAKEKMNAVNEAVQAAQEKYDEYDQVVRDTTKSVDDLNDEWDYMQDYIGEHQAAINESKKSYEELGASTELVTSVMSGNSEEITAALDNINNGFKTSTTATEAELRQQVTDLENNVLLMQQALNDGMPGVTQEMVDNCNDMVFKAKGELDKVAPAVAEATSNAADAGSSTFNEKSPEYQASAQAYGESGNAGYDEAGNSDHIVEAVRKACINHDQELTSHFQENYGVNAQYAKKGQEGYSSENSPEYMKTQANKETTAHNQEMTSKFAEAYGTGKAYARNVKDGVESEKAPDYMGNNANKATSAYNQEMTSKFSEAYGSGKGYAKSNKDGFDSQGVYDHYHEEGKTSGDIFAIGLASKSQLAKQAGEGLADNAIAGLDTADSYGMGIDFGDGYANGIWGSIGSVVAAAASMAVRAVAAVKDAQVSASPSKKTKKLAHDFGDGYAIGIEDKESEVEDAASGLADTAMGALDFSGIDVSAAVAKMKQVVAQDKAEIGSMLSAQFVNKAYKEISVENNSDPIDYDKLGSAVVKSFVRAGIRVDCDKRTFGRLVGEVI